MGMKRFAGDMWSLIPHSMCDENKWDLSLHRNRKSEEHALPPKQLHVVDEA
jgi:hypothetical protein